MDISLQVIVIAANHDLSTNPQKEAARYRRGDIVNVYLTADVGSPSLIRRFGFIHITGIPDGPDPEARFAKIEALLGDGVVDRVLVPDTDLPEMVEEATLVRTRAWRVPPSIIPVAKRNQLLTDRETTVTWTQAKPYVRKKMVTIKTDASADDETTELMDGDI